MQFDGSSSVDLQDLVISPYSYSIAVWLKFDENAISIDQTLLKDSKNTFKFGINPSAGEVAFEF